MAGIHACWGWGGVGVSAASAGSLSGLSWVVLVVVTALPCPWPGWEAPALLCGLVWAAAEYF